MLHEAGSPEEPFQCRWCGEGLCRNSQWPHRHGYLKQTWNGEEAAAIYEGPIMETLREQHGEKRRYFILEDNDPKFIRKPTRRPQPSPGALLSRAGPASSFHVPNCPPKFGFLQKRFAFWGCCGAAVVCFNKRKSNSNRHSNSNTVPALNH